MTPEKFEGLHSLLEEHLTKPYVVREPLPSRARLAITLRYLVSGMYMQDVALEFRVGISTVSATVHSTCRLLWTTLQPLYLKVATTEKWEEVARGFKEKCNFPNCVGAVDGKHVQIQAPPHSGSLYYNYKGTYSIVLLAVADSNLKYVMIDVGAYGRQSDGGTLSMSRFGKCLEGGGLGLPGPEHLPGTQTAAPHVFVGDEAFQLRPDFLRPYSGRSQSEEKRIFNYRLSRARRCVENTFGVMVSRFRVFRRSINLLPSNVDNVVMACCVLHNFLRDDVVYMSATSDDEPQDAANVQLCSDGGSSMLDLQPPCGHNYSRTAAETRDLFSCYFSSPCGAVPWQRTSAGLRN
ncbi:hypothetical protein V5799_011850 [Amblyomma americanum]|uniref:DDE Tnp4 domain-containing protein n=1 Tax=Amblyomma americanum TaxID=6943 RepID=A0AAQ4EG27_AMBAM